MVGLAGGGGGATGPVVAFNTTDVADASRWSVFPTMVETSGVSSEKGYVTDTLYALSSVQADETGAPLQVTVTVAPVRPDSALVTCHLTVAGSAQPVVGWSHAGVIAA